MSRQYRRMIRQPTIGILCKSQINETRAQPNTKKVKLVEILAEDATLYRDSGISVTAAIWCPFAPNTHLSSRRMYSSLKTDPQGRFQVVYFLYQRHDSSESCPQAFTQSRQVRS